MFVVVWVVACMLFMEVFVLAFLSCVLDLDAMLNNVRHHGFQTFQWKKQNYNHGQDPAAANVRGAPGGSVVEFCVTLFD
jgi:hypothetical protein